MSVTRRQYTAVSLTGRRGTCEQSATPSLVAVSTYEAGVQDPSFRMLALVVLSVPCQ